MMRTVDRDYSLVHNFFFHPLSNKSQKAKTALAIITNIFLTIFTGGLWQIPFWIVNRLDHKKARKLTPDSSPKVGSAASNIFSQQTPKPEGEEPKPQPKPEGEEPKAMSYAPTSQPSTTETPGTGTGTVNGTGAKEKVAPATMPPLSEIAFGVEQWENHFGKVEGTIPPLPDNIEDILKADCPFFAGKKVWQTHKLVLIPEQVNGQPLNELRDPMLYISSDLQMSDTAAHWLLITTDTVEGDVTLEKTYWEQRKIIEEISIRGDLPYKVPDALDVSIATLISHKIGKPLFREFRTRCEGRDRYGKALVSVSSILSISYPSDRKIEVVNLTEGLSPGAGMVAARLFFASGAEDTIKTTLDVSEIALGEKEWVTYFGEVGNAPPLPTNIQEIIGRDCPLVPGKKIWQTHTLVLIPEKVNGETLTLESIGQLARKPKAGFPSKYMDSASDPLTDEEFDQSRLPDLLKKQSAPSHWVLISNEVLRGENGGCETRQLTYREQSAALQKLAEKSPIPYTIASVRDLAISVFMRHVSKGDYPFGLFDPVFSRCLEITNGTPVALGGWYDSLNGLFVGCMHSNAAHNIGMAASWVIENDSIDETAPF